MSDENTKVKEKNSGILVEQDEYLKSQFATSSWGGKRKPRIILKIFKRV